MLHQQLAWFIKQTENADANTFSIHFTLPYYIAYIHKNIKLKKDNFTKYIPLFTCHRE